MARTMMPKMISRVRIIQPTIPRGCILFSNDEVDWNDKSVLMKLVWVLVDQGCVVCETFYMAGLNRMVMQRHRQLPPY